MIADYGFSVVERKSYRLTPQALQFGGSLLLRRFVKACFGVTTLTRGRYRCRR